MEGKELLLWCAGFLEGEGSFDGAVRGGKRVFSIQCSQVQEWPILLLVRAFGGAVCFVTSEHKKNHKRNPYYKWAVTGPKARETMRILYPYLSPKRQAKIDEIMVLAEKEILSAWQLNAAKTHCKRGHPLSGENLMRNSSGCRQCRTCQRLAQRKYELKKRQKSED